MWTPCRPGNVVSMPKRRAVSATLKNVGVRLQGSDLYLPSIGKQSNLTWFLRSTLRSCRGFRFEIVPSEAAAITKMGLEVMEEANKQHKVQHPLIPENKKIWQSSASIRAKTPGTASFWRQNAERSPCGTGTCAKMALLAGKQTRRVPPREHIGNGL